MELQKREKEMLVFYDFAMVCYQNLNELKHVKQSTKI